MQLVVCNTCGQKSIVDQYGTTWWSCTCSTYSTTTTKRVASDSTQDSAQENDTYHNSDDIFGVPI